MKTYLYRVGRITLLLCSLDCMPSDGVLHNILKKVKADFLCLLMPSVSHDAEINLYGAQALLNPYYEALIASAFHLSVTRGLPIYEYNILYSEKSYRITVNKNTGTVSVNAGKYKQLLSKIDISEGKYSLYAELVEAGELCLSLQTDDVYSVDSDKISQMISTLAPKYRLPCVIRSAQTPADVRFLPYARGETVPTLCAHIVASLSQKEGNLTFSCADVSWRIMRSHCELCVRPALKSTLQFDLFP